MKTLIVYGTTYGYAKDCAFRLKTLLSGDVDVVDAGSAMTVALAPYDHVIIGGSVYMGQVQKPVRKFCTQHKDVLQEKKLGLFLCCGLPENFSLNLETAFPEELRKSAISTECFGGRMDIPRMSFIHRTVAQMMTKAVASGKAQPVMEIPEALERMAEVMKTPL